MASWVVNVLVFLFSVTQVAWTARRSRLRPGCRAVFVVDALDTMPDAGLTDEADGPGVGVPDAANAAVPAPPMTAALAPTMAIFFHMMCSLVSLVGRWSYADNCAAPGCAPSQGIVRIVFGARSPSGPDMMP